MNPPSRYKVAFELGDPSTLLPGSPRTRIHVDPGKVEQGLLKLVLAVVELIRQLMEKQSPRRIDAGSLSREEIDRLGKTLMQLEAKTSALAKNYPLLLV